MNNNTLVLRSARNYLDRIIDSPFNSLIDEFFNNSFPTTLAKQDSFPKYNIKRAFNSSDKQEYDENCFIIEMALAGWNRDQFEVYTEKGTLYINSIIEQKENPQNSNINEYFYRGIASREFSWSMNLPKYAVIETCDFVNGLLSITVRIQVPEEQKRKLIEVR